MVYKVIDYDVTDRVCVITLNRPDKMNALTSQMRAEIPDAIQHAQKDGARVIVITGNGGAFCSGQDLGDAKVGGLDLERGLRDEYNPMLRAIVECPLPVIAAVNGPAAGAGANLALAADVVIASEAAYFMQAFTRIGLIPDAGGTYSLPRNMGQAKAMGAALFGEKISARQADDWGMIWEAVPEADFEARWRARAEFLANGPTKAYELTKRAIRDGWDNTFEEQLTLEAKQQGKAGKTRDFMEGVVAFLEKRKAHFQGR
ncbi:enoyl-CoA hydratase-related protein [Rhodalgimonas zhirmunskyi]|uniref:Enoyl-CoA hydratase-related protein n=1 Tax=Rhodalgimonas zhirmunskyi TaxID=2964767 RepID=A0AAJ1U7E7_9RHOB|nr:enoyl-CoA hydratase-related protein [Rhodoalgimonas zhirmunskyi]MDQ2092673.1 enoyl-CoA hydratase-related protein [Rhodoalgimonas zhirmunskyi]